MNNPAIKVYPNPAGDYVVFELHTPTNKNAVIPVTAGRRNPTANGSPQKQGDSSPAKAGFGMTGVDDMTVIVVDVFGQEVARLLVKHNKTVWDCREVKNGIYFYKIEIEGSVLCGKIVVQE